MKNYSYEEIFRMLLPKLKKHYPDIEHRIVNDGVDWAFLLSLCYKSGYTRGQLGRSFIIGEKKERASDIVFQVGDSVKLISKKGIDNESNRYFPLIGTTGEVVELGSDYCFVQWPKDTTADNGVWACRNIYLEKVTEHWAPATEDNVKVGSKVKMIDGEAHNTDPYWFPAAGTLGIVKKTDYNNCLIQWPEGATSGESEWWSIYKRLEVLLCE